ncbi:MAG: peptidoglycan DD-metalloendopeptidase family protein [Pseudomonadota bacterium]
MSNTTCSLKKTYPETFDDKKTCKNWNLANPVLSKKSTSKNNLHKVDPLSRVKSALRASLDIKQRFVDLRYNMAQASLTFVDRYALHKLIKLRKRSILTASNRLRLRYVALNIALVATAATYLTPDMSKISLKPNLGSFQFSYEQAQKTPERISPEKQVVAEKSEPTQMALFTEEELASLEKPKSGNATTEKLTPMMPSDKEASKSSINIVPSEKPARKTASKSNPVYGKKSKTFIPKTASHELTPAPFKDEPFLPLDETPGDTKTSGAEALLALFSRTIDPSDTAHEDTFVADESLAVIEPASGAADIDINPGASGGFQDPPSFVDQVKTFEVGRGDTLGKLLEKAGLSSSEVHYVIKAMSKHYNPRYVKPGQDIKVTFEPDHLGGEFKHFAVHISPIQELTVKKKADGSFSASVAKEELVKRTNSVSTNIETSLYGSALKSGIPQSVVAEMIRLYSWSVDFQRDIRSGDKIEVFYETMENEDGTYKEFGNIIFANLGVGGRDKPIYRYRMKDGDIDYFEPDGRSIRKTLMRTPIDGARLSSGFGMRKHPVLGYNKMHKGVDFAAPTGTPIYAAGDGTIESLGRKGGYGNYIRIRHNSKLKTAYAHLHKYKKGLGKGSRVKQGQVIGYVGTTGRSTGPHLHYEVLVGGVQKNPRSVNVPTGEELEGTEFVNFKAYMSAVKQRYVAHHFGDGSEKIKVAQNKVEKAASETP